MNKSSQLSHIHFQYRIWRNELEMMQKETDFFLGVIEEIVGSEEPTPESEQGWFINQFHHFQRFIKHLQTELSGIEKALAEGAIQDKGLDKEQKLDYQYFKEEIDCFEQDYRSVKSKFRAFIAETESEKAS